MKVICVSNIMINSHFYKLDITINKEYIVLDTNLDSYLICDEEGDLIFYNKIYFITLEEFRNRQIEKLL